MFVFGIETTCDETAAAIVEDGKTIYSHVIASQHELMSQFGGVFPEIASRRQFELLLPVIEKAKTHSVDLIAVARGPGLIGSLFMGMTAAKALALAWQKPFIGVNHVEAHLYAAMMEETPPLPALGVVVSGGHTLLVLIHELGRYELIGATVDDAVGEAFDKVGVLLGLHYPAGGAIEAWAKEGDSKRFSFPMGRVKEKPFHLSYSGLKTSVAHTIEKLGTIDHQTGADLAASFQEAALNAVVVRALEVAKRFDARSIVVGGGVSQNMRLRTLFQQSSLPLYFPPKELCGDNAVMIAALGFHLFKMRGEDSLDLEPAPNLPLA